MPSAIKAQLSPLSTLQKTSPFFEYSILPNRLPAQPVMAHLQQPHKRESRDRLLRTPSTQLIRRT